MLVSLVIVTLISLVLPLAVMELLNIVADITDHSTLPAEIWWITGILIGVYALRFIIGFFLQYLRRCFAENTFTQIRSDVYSHLQTLSPRFYHDKQIGEISNRLGENIHKVYRLVGWALPDFFIAILTMIGVGVILFILNPLMAAFACVPIAFIIAVSLFELKAREPSVQRKKLTGELYGMLEDNLQGMREIQIFGKQEHENNRFRAKQEEIKIQGRKAFRIWSFGQNTIEFLQNIGIIIVVFAGAYFAMQGEIEAGAIIAFIMYIGMLYAPVHFIVNFVEEGIDVTTSIARTFEYIDYQSEIKDRPDARVAENLHGNIEFKNVAFGYKEARVLENISFKADAGQMVALVGETGSGKTTVASLVARFYDVDSGSISIDGIDIRDYTLQSLRNHLSFVLQDVFLFNGTIAENIAYGGTGTPAEADIIKVAKFACIHNFIDSLPEKYDTRIGERGVKLSGGQKQRLAIARALLRNSPIIVLDEATSSIDNTTEKEIQKAIEKLSQDKTRTIIVIAHRLSTIEKADKILYIDKAKIIEQGTHEELLAKNGAYARLRNQANI